MDMSSLMNNPAMMQMAQAMMQDPEVMQLMQQPGMMEKVQAAMANPQLAMSDPDLMRIAMKLQSMGGGGMGGMGGMPGMGGAMGSSGASGAGAGAAGDIKHLSTPADLQSLLASAGSRLVAVDFFTTWCGPCKMIAPTFAELASTYRDRVLFAKVDCDRARPLAEQQGVSAFPHFQFFLNGSLVDEFKGANVERLRQIVEMHANAEPPPPPCPYKHFPLKEQETVKYADIKWELVTPKFRELNDKLPADSPQRLSSAELSTLDALLAVLQDRAAYHSSQAPSGALALLRRLLAWPADSLSPPLHLVRMAALHPDVAKQLASEASSRGANDCLAPLLRVATEADKPLTSMLAVRAAVNCFQRRALAKSVASRYDDLIEAAAAAYAKHPADDNLRLSVVALFINCAILFAEDSTHFQAAKVLLLTSVHDCLTHRPIDARLCYRLGVVVGSLVYGDAEAAELAADLDVMQAMRSAAAEPTCKDDVPTQQLVAELDKAIASRGK